MGQEATADPRALRSRRRALDAAAAILLRDGFAAVTHQRVADEADLGRRTLYRHWPERDGLLRDVLAEAEYPHAPVTGDLREDLVAHVEALRRALVEGPLRYVVLALNERAAVQPELRPLRDELTTRGCEPVRRLLAGAVAAGSLPADLDVDAAAAEIEGPLFYRSLVLGQAVAPEVVPAVVDGFLRSHSDPSPR